MVDEQQADPDKSRQTTAPAQAAPQGDDWGSDWESAFQAEEFTVDEAEGTTPLAETSQNDANDFTIAEEDSLDVLPHDDGAAGPRVSVGAEDEPAARAAGPGPAARLMTRCMALPMPIRLGIPAALLLLLIGITLFQMLKRPAQIPPPQATLPTAPAGAPASPPAEVAAPAVVEAPAAEPAPADTGPQPVEKSHTTWPFTSFIIPVMDKDTKATIFVTVELDLVIALDNAKDGPPLSRKPFVRDTIFQFFVNRPPYDLRHYALAQGEMSDQLREWLRMQWPEGELETVTIKSYKLD